MRSIKDEVRIEMVIRHSTFITCLMPVSDVKMIEERRRRLKDEYPDANHHCYAYLLGDNQEIQKASDDGEPSGTAGVPILEVFKKNAVTDVLCVVIRYFGGVKLGAGGLIRAYKKSASEALKESVIAVKKTFLYMEIAVDFSLIGVVENILKDHGDILSRDYSDKALYRIAILKDAYDDLHGLLMENTNGQAEIRQLRKETRYT